MIRTKRIRRLICQIAINVRNGDFCAMRREQIGNCPADTSAVRPRKRPPVNVSGTPLDCKVSLIDYLPSFLLFVRINILKIFSSDMNISYDFNFSHDYFWHLNLQFCRIIF
jgi:hypothetical protein|tara:strand:- start:11571 stop:11903 length:333 start_codon:yes stop_codon:yes gene_type:complete